MGAVGKSRGSTAASPNPRMRPRTGRRYWRTADAEASTTAAAPSEMGEALPAVGGGEQKESGEAAVKAQVAQFRYNPDLNAGGMSGTYSHFCLWYAATHAKEATALQMRPAGRKPTNQPPARPPVMVPPCGRKKGLSLRSFSTFILEIASS